MGIVNAHCPFHTFDPLIINCDNELFAILIFICYETRRIFQKASCMKAVSGSEVILIFYDVDLALYKRLIKIGS
jgi:hypothetical protein